ncbi:MAG: AAA family ATPase [Candidatus Parabeggiatoa sp.]|nr:AAA family ATPase [Candidatus Parabeggiatoa sp.]
MSIQSFTLKNYRSFVDRTTIELRPLTLLFGYNNSGKSALLRALPLIMDSLKGESRTPLALDSPAIRGSHFSDLLSHISGTQAFDIELSIFEYDLKWTIRHLPELKTHVVSHYDFFRTDSWIIKAQWLAKPLKQKEEYEVQINKGNIYREKLYFDGLLANDYSTIRDYKAEIEDEMRNENTHVQWLTSVRKPALRNNPFKGAAPKYLEPDGRGTADILAYDSILEELQILPKVSRWYEKYLQQKIVVEEMGEHFQIKLQRLTKSPCKVNIVDVGEGLIQVLPVLVACAMASEGYTNMLAIEEPESHLHPRLHAALAEHFFELARQDEPPKVLLETHSENFLLRTQLEIAQGKLDPKLVMVYWVRQLDDGRSIAEPVVFDRKGRPQGEWPRDVFYSDIELSRQLVQERRKQS